MSQDPLPLTPEEWDRLRRGLRIVALRSLGDPEDAEDVAQETLARAVAAVRAGRPESDERFTAFVWGIARHVIASRHRARSSSITSGLDRDPPDRGKTQLESLLRKEESEIVRRALRRLAPRDREVLRLSYFEGLKPADIAARLAEPVVRIRKRKSRALARLRAAFFGRRDADAADASVPAQAGHELSPRTTNRAPGAESG